MTLSRQNPPGVMLSAMFIAGGIDSLRNPAAKVPAAEKVAPEIAGRLPLPDDTEQLVKINAAVQVGAGGLLALGKLPGWRRWPSARPLIPTTLAGHRFWEEQDAAQQRAQRIHFLQERRTARRPAAGRPRTPRVDRRCGGAPNGQPTRPAPPRRRWWSPPAPPCRSPDRNRSAGRRLISRW